MILPMSSGIGSPGDQSPGFPRSRSGLEGHQLHLTGWKVPLHLAQQLRNSPVSRSFDLFKENVVANVAI